MRIRGRIISVIIALLMVGLLGGCGGSNKEKEVSKIKDGEATPTAAVTEEESKEVEAEGSKGEPTKVESFQYKMHLGTVEVQTEEIYSEDFEDGKTEFKGRGQASVQIVDDKFYEGKASLYISKRADFWNGATVDLSKQLKVGEAYYVEAAVMYEQGPDTMQIDCKLEKNSNEYLNFASTMATKGEWILMSGTIIIPEGTTTAQVYFETGAGVDFVDFYVDRVSIKREIVTANRGDIPSLKEAYQDYFSVGVACTNNEISEERRELIVQQFNSLTAGNEMKPEALLDYAKCISDPGYDENPAVNFSRVETMLKFAQDSGLKMRGHTLVWHSQTPRWFFAEGYSKEPNAPLVSKELMLKRLENYIKNVLEYMQTNYPGLVYAWDVVNEAINPSDGEVGGYRSKDSLWYQVIGPEFVEKAFEYARKYADPEVKLFYNDYNTEESGRMLAILDLVKKLQEKKLIDGIGLQSHISIDSPSLIKIEESIRKYAELGLEIQLTELDMAMEEYTQEAYNKQAQRYKRLFTLIKNLDETGAANITNVTFWGLSDDITWLSKPGVPSYPLLFDKYLKQKPAFWGVLLSPDIPLY